MKELVVLMTMVFAGVLPGCTTADGVATVPDGGPNMIGTSRGDSGEGADRVAAECPNALKATVTNGVVSDGERGFQFLVPTGFMSRRVTCEEYPSLVQIVPEANREPRRVSVINFPGKFEPKNDSASTNSAGVTFYLVPGFGQETGKISDWHLVIPRTDWMIQVSTDAEGKAVLEEIAAGFRWTR